MSLADDLLNSIIDEVREEETGGISPETEGHIIVDADRTITVPDELKRIAVQYDHNVETVTFDCVRYWDGHDFSKMAIYINYACSKGILGTFLAENVAVDENDENMIHFTWTISGNVTRTEGKLAFLVCVKRTDENGNEAVHWNTELNNQMYVSEGLECTDVIEMNYPDLYTQLLQRMGENEIIVSKLVEEGANQALLSQSYAVGTEDKVREDDSNDNAKYYSELAKTSEEAARTSAEEAATSEINAKTSEEAARTSAEEAATSEINAKTSEEAARTSAEEAATSALNSAASSREAKTYAEEAANNINNAVEEAVRTTTEIANAAATSATDSKNAATRSEAAAKRAEEVSLVGFATEDTAGIMRGGDNTLDEDGTLVLTRKTTEKTLLDSKAGGLVIESIGGDGIVISEIKTSDGNGNETICSLSKQLTSLTKESFDSLPVEDQIALLSLTTFDGTTYISTDSEIEPVIELEYGTSPVGAYALKGLNAVEIERLESQIMAKELNENVVTKLSFDKPIFVFIDDDGATQFNDLYSEVLEPRGIVGGLSIMSNTYDTQYYTYLSQEEILAYQAKGWSILNHSCNGDAITLDNAEANLRYAINKFEDKGYENKHNIFVYPDGNISDDAEAIAAKVSEYFSYGLNVAVHNNQKIDLPIANRYDLGRVFISENLEESTKTFIKGCIDDAIANNGLLFISTHATVCDKEYLSEVLDYILGMGYKFSTPDEAFDLIEQNVEQKIGDAVVGLEDEINDLEDKLKATSISSVIDGYDLENWTSSMVVEPNPADNTVCRLDALTYGDGKYVTVSGAERIYYSSNGITWTATSDVSTLQTSASPSITYANGLFVMVSTITTRTSTSTGVTYIYDGIIHYSTDAVNWTKVTNGPEMALTNVEFVNDKFIICGHGGMYYSTDGVTWNICTGLTSAGHYMTHVEYGNGIYVALGYSYTSGGSTQSMSRMCGYYSSDGIAWAAIDFTTYDTTYYRMQCKFLGYTGNKFIACYYNSLSPVASKICYSEDGVNWEVYDSSISFADLCGVCHDGEKFIAFIAGDSIYYSTDAINWTSTGYECTDMNVMIYDGKGFAGVDSNGYFYKTNVKYNNTIEKVDYTPTFFRVTLLSGETVITVTDDRIKEDSMMSFYTSIYGVNPKEVTVSNGKVTLTFDAQETDMEVGVRVDG